MIPATLLENVMRNFNDCVQECVNVEGRYLQGIIFHNCFFFQAEDGIRDAQESRGLGDVYKRQLPQV